MRAYGVRAAFAAAAILVAPASFAQSPVETVIRDWVASIDATADWAADIRDLTYDATTDTATISGLAIRTENPGVEIGFEAIVVTGYSSSHGGGIRAKSVTADAGTIELGFMKVALADIALNDLAVPPIAGFPFDREKPFTSLMRGYAEFIRSELASAHIGSLDLIQQIEGVTTRASYGRMRVEGFADGKIAKVTAGPLKLEAPSDQGLVVINIGGVDGTDIDLDAFVRVYNPDAYVGGKGDMVWRGGLGRAAYRDFEIQVPDGRLAFDEVAFENIRLRQPERSFSEIFDVILSKPDMNDEDANKLLAPHLLDMLSAFGFGRLGFENFQVAATGIDRFSIAGFHLDDFSIDGIGEFALEGVDAAVPGQGALNLGRFAFGGIAFPPLDTLRQALAASEGESAQPDPMKLIPTLGFVEVGQVAMALAGMPQIALERFRFDLRDYIGPVPTAIKIDMAGLDVPLSTIDDPSAKAMFAKLGYDRIVADWSADIAWRSATESLDVEGLRAGIKGMGSVAIDASLGGLPRSAIENPDRLEQVLPGLTLLNGKVTFTDDSIVGKGLDIFAEYMKAPPDKFRQQFADAMPFLLSMTVLNDPQLMALVQKSKLLTQLTPAVKQFVAAPGASITFNLAPPAPVALPTLMATVDSAPEKLVEMLGLTISGSAPPAAPAPATPTIAPSSPSVQSPRSDQPK